MTLAARLHVREHDLRATSDEVHALLSSLFSTWQGWVYTDSETGEYGIDVFHAVNSPRAVAVLHRHGFSTVMLHPHGKEQTATCVCKAHELR